MARGKDAALVKLQATIEAEHAKYKSAVLAAVESTLAECGLTLADLLDANDTSNRASGERRKKRKAPFKGVQPRSIATPRLARRGAEWAVRRAGSQMLATVIAS
jgi:hypothetical protein